MKFQYSIYFMIIFLSIIDLRASHDNQYIEVPAKAIIVLNQEEIQYRKDLELSNFNRITMQRKLDKIKLMYGYKKERRDAIKKELSEYSEQLANPTDNRHANIALLRSILAAVPAPADKTERDKLPQSTWRSTINNDIDSCGLLCCFAASSNPAVVRSYMSYLKQDIDAEIENLDKINCREQRKLLEKGIDPGDVPHMDVILQENKNRSLSSASLDSDED